MSVVSWSCVCKRKWVTCDGTSNTTATYIIMKLLYNSAVVLYTQRSDTYYKLDVASLHSLIWKRTETMLLVEVGSRADRLQLEEETSLRSCKSTCSPIVTDCISRANFNT